MRTVGLDNIVQDCLVQILDGIIADYNYCQEIVNGDQRTQ
jgi:hypothetical protein